MGEAEDVQCSMERKVGKCHLYTDDPFAKVLSPCRLDPRREGNGKSTRMIRPDHWLVVRKECLHQVIMGVLQNGPEEIYLRGLRTSVWNCDWEE